MPCIVSRNASKKPRALLHCAILFGAHMHQVLENSSVLLDHTLYLELTIPKKTLGCVSLV